MALITSGKSSGLKIGSQQQPAERTRDSPGGFAGGTFSLHDVVPEAYEKQGRAIEAGNQAGTLNLAEAIEVQSK